MKSSYITKVIDNLKNRFLDIHLMNAMKVLNSANLPDADTELGDHGNDDLTVLFEHYGKPKPELSTSITHSQLIDSKTCQSEWLTLRAMAYTSYKNLSLKEFWKIHNSFEA